MASPSGSVSVVVSSFEEPDHLCLVLTALSRQSAPPAEVLVADDGSSPRTLEALRAWTPAPAFRLVHVWQPHEEFRLARSRNNAIHRARGTILAFLDQDTLPHRRWLETHLAHVRPGAVSIGLKLSLDPSLAAGLSRDAVEGGGFENAIGAEERRCMDALQRKCRFYVIMRRLGLGVNGRPAVNFANAAASRDDLIRANGFDEDYVGWGQEDDDLGWRLYMAGVRPVAVVNRALVSHIPHPPRHGGWKAGRNIERYRRKRLSFRCAKGLDAHPHPDVVVTVVRD